jgi:uncharacterized repeat protein (TIGR01451 family)
MSIITNAACPGRANLAKGRQEMRRRMFMIGITALAGLTLALVWTLGDQHTPVVAAPAPPEGPRAPAAELHVCPAGSPTCDYASIQAAVDGANDGDTIKVATGVYTDVHARAGITQVVYISRTVVIQGGYTTPNWTTPDPDANPTMLDAEMKGRVLYIAGDINPTIEGLHITGGDAAGLGGGLGNSDAGGGVYVVTATVTISDSQIVGNTSAQYGGGLYLYRGAVTLNDNTIGGNSSYYGGGLYTIYSDATLYGNTFISNTATSRGAGVYLNEGDVTLINNTFSANVASSYGGGLYLAFSYGTLTGNTITGNIADTIGGGLYANYSPITLDGNTIAANRTTGVNSQGGGLYVNYSDATLTHNTVTTNTAGSSGGGLYLFQSDVTLAGNTFVANTAGDYGGGVYVYYGDGSIIDSNTVVSNTANYGGGLYLSWCNATFANTLVADNRGTTAGSGLYMRASSPRLIHTTIARNSGGDGSGVYFTEFGITFSTVTLTNTIVASQTVGIMGTTGNTATLEATLWGSGAWANGSDWVGNILTGTINTWGNPDFVAPNGQDYHIASGSAARDAGIYAGVGRDIDGQVRPMDLGYDVGADEYAGVGLDIVKRPSAVYVTPGQVFTYYLTVTSAGSSPATGVILTDTLSILQRPLAATSSAGACLITDSGWGGTVVCTPATMLPSATVAITLTVELFPDIPLRQKMVNTLVATANETANSTQATIYTHDCYARINDETTAYYTIQSAVDAAQAGDLVKVAGICLGTSARGQGHQQVYVDKSLTIRGGYTTTNGFAEPADWTANPTTLDAWQQGRVLFVAQGVSATIEGLILTQSGAEERTGCPSTLYGESCGGGR